jgi:hypothetical protein
MISADEVIAAYIDGLALHDHGVLVRGDDTTGVKVRCRVYEADMLDMEGTARATTRRAVVLAKDLEDAGFAFPIQVNSDCLIWAGKTMVIKEVDEGTRRVAGRRIAFNLDVSGA